VRGGDHQMKKLLILIFIPLSILAQDVSLKIIAPIKTENANLGIGSKVQLYFKSNDEQRPAIFLGRMVDQESKSVEFLFLDEKKTRIRLIDPGNINGFKKSNSQVIIQPINQRGSTCAAYGVFHFWNQMKAVGYRGSEELDTVLDSDRKRLQFLEEVIDIYYLQNKLNITNLMKNFGQRFGFVCKNNPFTDAKKAAEFIFNKASEGKPVLIDFNIGPNMVTSTYDLVDYETVSARDARLWVPRKIGQRKSGGHVIVAAAAFVSNGRKKNLVLDSDWSDPRVWDLERYISQAVAMKEMGFHSCN
jgi:hypothetical protein